MRTSTLWLGMIGLLLLNASCAFHKKADEWNSLVGPDGNRVYLNSTTKVGLNVLVFLPFIGDTDIEGMVEEATEQIHEEGGDYVRIVQSTSENYWHAFPPITLVVTPVVHSLVAEYRPYWEFDEFVAPDRFGVAPNYDPDRSYNWRPPPR